MHHGVGLLVWSEAGAYRGGSGMVKAEDKKKPLFGKKRRKNFFMLGYGCWRQQRP
jgi:hypothetical protein